MPSVGARLCPGRLRRRVHAAQRNAEAFHHWGMVPRMMVDCTTRDLSIDLFGMTLPTPLFMSPIGVTGLCTQDGHGDLAAARASVATGVPLVASTLSNDPLEIRRARRSATTPGFFQLYTPKSKRARREPRPPRRDGGLQGHRRDARHLGDRLAPARSQHRQFPAAARPCADQLFHRSRLPRDARPSRPKRTAPPRSRYGRRPSARC